MVGYFVGWLLSKCVDYFALTNRKKYIFFKFIEAHWLIDIIVHVPILIFLFVNSTFIKWFVEGVPFHVKIRPNRFSINICS